MKEARGKPANKNTSLILLKYDGGQNAAQKAT